MMQEGVLMVKEELVAMEMLCSYDLWQKLPPTANFYVTSAVEM